MIIDHHFYVPAGMRNSETRKFSEFKYTSPGELRDAGQPPATARFSWHTATAGTPTRSSTSNFISRTPKTRAGSTAKDTNGCFTKARSYPNA
jgi:hypothetical protein